MKYPLNVLLSGRSKAELNELYELISRQSGISLQTRINSNGHSDPLHNIDPLPDALIYVVSDEWADELSALSERPASQRPPTLVVGPAGDFTLVRMAMQAGARDFFTQPLSEEDLYAALERLARDLNADPRNKTANLTVVINAKGGSGASVVATNIAYLMSLKKERRTVLIDLDLQFGTVPVYLDMRPNNGLLKALHEVEKLDGLAIEGLMLKHPMGLRVLATSPDELVMSHEVPESRIAALFELLGRTYDEIIVDVPRQFDSITSLVIGHADKIVILMEPNLAHLRDAKRLLLILRQVLGIPSDRLIVILNRYDRKGDVQLNDIKNALEHEDVMTLPSDYRRVTESINLGSPIVETARNSPVAKELLGLTERLCSETPRTERVTRQRRKLFDWARVRN